MEALLSSPLTLLAVGVLGLAGFLILLVVGLGMMRNERGPRGEKSTPAPKEPAASTTPPAAEPAPKRRVPEWVADEKAAMTNPLGGITSRFGRRGTPGPANAHEVLRVLRDNLTGRILVELSGQRYANLNDIQDAALRQALLTTLHDLEAFRSGIAAEPAPTPAEPPAAAATVARMAPAAEPTPPVTPTRATSSAFGESRPLPPPSMNPFKQMAVLREMQKAAPEAAPKTIAEQIDAVLQERIAGTPLDKRGIRMRPSPRGEALFELDGASYTAVDQLPDESAREAVRAAIAEWEAKQ